MSPLVNLLLGLALVSCVLSFFCFWGAARCVAGPAGTFLTALKCQVILSGIGIPTTAFLGFLFYFKGLSVIFYLAMVTASFGLLVVGFMVPMRVFGIGFLRTLGLLLLNLVFTGIGNQVVSVVLSPLTAPILKREAPALAQRIRTFTQHKGTPLAAATPAPVAAPLEVARQDVETARTDLKKTETQANQTYVELAEKRKTLDTKNGPAVHAFNEAAAGYALIKTRLADQKGELARLIKQEELLQIQATAATAKRERAVVMYSTSWCPSCKAAKQYFAQRNIPCEEIDVEHSPEGAAEFRRLGGGGVPLIVIKGDKMTGFNSAWVEEHLKK